MNYNTYSIFDTASGIYSIPFFFHNDAMAIRAFTDLAVNQDQDVGKHPEDYTLCKIGTWDNVKGLQTGQAVESLATALEVIAASRKIDKPAMDLMVQHATPKHLNSKDNS